MRTKQLYPGINNSQKICVILNGVGIYTTVMQAQSIFLYTDHRAAVDVALDVLAQQRGAITGYSSRYNGIDFQVNLV